MRRRREVGVALAFVRGGGSIAFAPEEYAAIRDAWLAGQRYAGTGFHGDPQSLDMREVYFVNLYTAEAMAAQRAEDAADAADDRQDEMLSGSIR